MWEAVTPSSSERPDHPTPKPIPLMERLLRVCSPLPGSLVLDPFGGSGQTLLAAENTGKRCYTMEIEPKYADMIVTRWQAQTGRDATREADGARFRDLM